MGYTVGGMATVVRKACGHDLHAIGIASVARIGSVHNDGRMRPRGRIWSGVNVHVLVKTFSGYNARMAARQYVAGDSDDNTCVVWVEQVFALIIILGVWKLGEVQP